MVSFADGDEARMCVPVCDFRQSYPLPCLPCLSTHSTYVLPCSLSSLPLLIPNHQIFCCVISTSLLSELKYGWHTCFFCHRKCPLCSTWAFWCIYIHKHTNTHTHTVPFSLCSQTLIKGVFDFFFCCPGPTCPSRMGVERAGRGCAISLELSEAQNYKSAKTPH